MTRNLREIADGVVAAGLSLGGRPSSALDEAFENLQVAVKAAYPTSGSGDQSFLAEIVRSGLAPTVDTDYERWRPLHWVVQAPDVLVDHGGFDAVIGNPPFLGGMKISAAMGTNVRDWISSVVSGQGAGGRADLVAYFFLRASALLRTGGTLGLVATNTVAQGDTREVGLDQMVAAGFTITRSIQSRPWPAASANLEFAAVWGTTKAVGEDARRVCDGQSVPRITTLLEPGGRVEGNPIRLRQNLGQAFNGCNINGKGFELPPEAAAEMIANDGRNAEVLKPLLGGEDINQIPDLVAPMWVVDFYPREAQEAATYEEPFAWVEAHARPHRQSLKTKPKLGQRWWRFERDAVAMRVAIKDLDEVLAIALVSKSLMPVRVPGNHVFSHALAVFATSSFAEQAVLSSTLHQMWAIKYGSAMRNDPRYTTGDVYETFPRPTPTPRLQAVGRELDEERRQIMLRRDIGLTKLYNMVNDPFVGAAINVDIARIRDIHVELDEAVMEAYNWSGVELAHGFHTYRQMERWTVSPAARVEILDLLLEENHKRAAAEGSTAQRRSKRDGAVSDQNQASLFGDA